MTSVMNTMTGFTGITVGRRKNGAVAVLFDVDDSIGWFDAELFARFFEVVG